MKDSRTRDAEGSLILGTLSGKKNLDLKIVVGGRKSPHQKKERTGEVGYMEPRLNGKDYGRENKKTEWEEKRCQAGAPTAHAQKKKKQRVGKDPRKDRTRSTLDKA